MKKRKDELDIHAYQNARNSSKCDINYQVLFYEAVNVGVNAAGEETENELPVLIDKYRKLIDNNFHSEVIIQYVEGLQNPIYYAEFKDLKNGLYLLNCS